MKTIKVYCLHPFCKDIDSFLKYIKVDLSEFDLVWDKENPDYLISTDNVFVHRKYHNDFIRLYNKERINILLAVEAMSPDFNLFDYAIGFDCNLKNGDRFIQQLPPFIMYQGFLPNDTNEIFTVEEALSELNKKTAFCNFLYSNWNAHPIRDELFFAISSYKEVHSLGRHLNNVGEKGTGWLGHSSDCNDIKRPYKFSIACENASFNGYTSEKIYTSLAAHTVPIYWGDPEVVRNVNPDCFINCNNYSSIDEVINVVRMIDCDDELWAKMVSSPWRTDKQVKYHKARLSQYESFIKKIFSQDINSAHRIAEGTYPNKVRVYAMSGKPVQNNILATAIKKYKSQKRDEVLRIKYQQGK